MVATDSIRVAMISLHTCPLAALGGKKTGGMNVYVRELGKELGRRGIKVDIFTRSQDPCIPHVNHNALHDNVRVIHIPAGPEEPLSTFDIYPYVDDFARNMQSFADEEGLSYDVIHSHYWLSGLAAQYLKDVWDIPVLQMFHTLGEMKNRISEEDLSEELELRIQSESDIMNFAEGLIAATAAERIQLMWLYGADMKKIKVIPPGVDNHHFRPIPRKEARQAIGIDEDDKLLLFVGRIEPLKGIDTLIKAIALLKESVPNFTNDVCLSIVGGDLEADANEEMGRLKSLCEELELNDLITFLGAKNQHTLQYYYSAAEAVIMPSHYESFGMVALEAMACGTPVIASEVGGLAYLIEDGVTGFHVPDRDPDELAGRIRLLLENSALRDELSYAAFAVAQSYSWSRIASDIIACYHDQLESFPAS